MKHLYILAGLLLSFVSCKNNQKKYEIKGVDMINTDSINTPVQNITFSNEQDTTTLVRNDELYQNI